MFVKKLNWTSAKLQDSVGILLPKRAAWKEWKFGGRKNVEKLSQIDTCEKSYVVFCTFM